MSEPLVIYDLVDHIATLTLNNPKRRHALSSPGAGGPERPAGTD